MPHSNYCVCTVCTATMYIYMYFRFKIQRGLCSRKAIKVSTVVLYLARSPVGGGGGYEVSRAGGVVCLACLAIAHLVLQRGFCRTLRRFGAAALTKLPQSLATLHQHHSNSIGLFLSTRNLSVCIIFNYLLSSLKHHIRFWDYVFKPNHQFW